MKDLLFYGTPLTSYSGEGTLRTQEGQDYRCTFEAGQLNNGMVILTCDFIPPFPKTLSIEGILFEGNTMDGYSVRGTGFREINYLPKIDFSRAAVYTAFVMTELHVQKVKDAKPNLAFFGITNFMIDGLHATPLGSGIQFYLQSTEAIVLPIQNYSTVTKRLQVIKGIDITCEVAFRLENVSLEESMRIMTTLCYILSIAGGTKINWIYIDYRNNNGETLGTSHFLRIAKAFVPLPIVNRNFKDTKFFVEKSYATYASKQESYRLNVGTVDAYLDSKSEHDYLELRGLKAAVTLEILKSVFMEIPDFPVKAYIDDSFEQWLPIVRQKITMISDDELRPDIRKKISEPTKIKGLFRTSFKSFLKMLFAFVGLEFQSKELQLLVECRNKLVHYGQFYCQSADDADRKRCKPLESPWNEYTFLVSTLDKIFLKILEYQGPFIDWESGQPLTRDLN